MRNIERLFVSVVENSGDDMDISPDGSPTPSSGSHHKSRESRPPSTTAPAQPQQPQQNQQQQSGAPANSSGLPAPDQSLMWGQGKWLIKMPSSPHFIIYRRTYYLVQFQILLKHL